MANPPDPFRDAPDELVSFFLDAVCLRNRELRIHPLTADESRSESAALQETDFGEALGLIALDDANDSNPYCLISRGIGRGMVLYYSHDGSPEIRFADLASFKAALIAACDQNLSIDELPAEPLRPYADQQTLANTLAELNRDDGDTAEFLLCLFVPLLSPEQLPTFEQLGTNASFFVRESIASYIEMHPRPEHQAVAARLAADPHPQVSKVGKKALSCVNRVLHSKSA